MCERSTREIDNVRKPFHRFSQWFRPFSKLFSEALRLDTLLLTFASLCSSVCVFVIHILEHIEGLFTSKHCRLHKERSSGRWRSCVQPKTSHVTSQFSSLNAVTRNDFDQTFRSRFRSPRSPERHDPTLQQQDSNPGRKYRRSNEKTESKLYLCSSAKREFSFRNIRRCRCI